MKHILSKTLLSLSVLASASAFAADGYVTGNVYLRAGPDSGYPVVEMLDAGTPVAIEGCVNGWSWCDVDAGGGNRGWVAGDFLQDDYRGQRVLVPQYGIQIGIPIISFVFATYWQNHYRNESWYSQRQRWSEVRPRYQTVVVQHNTHGNSQAPTRGDSRGTLNTNPTSHGAASERRAETTRTAVVTAPARSAHGADSSRTATPLRPVAMNVEPAQHADRSLPVAHNAAAPRTQASVSRTATQRQATQRPVTSAPHQQAARPEAQQKKPAQKSKQDKNKRPDSSGQL